MEVADWGWVVAGAVQASWSGPTGRLPLQCPRPDCPARTGQCPANFHSNPIDSFSPLPVPSRPDPRSTFLALLHNKPSLPGPTGNHRTFCLSHQHRGPFINLYTRPLLQSKFALPSPISPSDIHCTSVAGFYHRFLLCIPTHTLLLTRTRHNGRAHQKQAG